MPLNVIDHPALPECVGRQWSVVDEDQLAVLVAKVLIGRAHHVERILQGAQQQAVGVPNAQRTALQLLLLTTNEAIISHRDGLLFEIISWIVAVITSATNEVISMPHLKSTQQGLDTIKVGFDQQSRTLTQATIYEQKCTVRPRDRFRDEVLPAFQAWVSHSRDNQLTQEATALLVRFNLTDEEQLHVYDRLVQEHPLVFDAALTVTPVPFETDNCVALFADYATITPNVEDRWGNTFPIPDIRAWFAALAQNVWQRIEANNV